MSLTKVTNSMLESPGGGAVASVNGYTGVVVLTAADVGAAATSHNHAASAITSGTFDIARLPVAADNTSSSTEVVRANGARTPIRGPSAKSRRSARRPTKSRRASTP